MRVIARAASTAVQSFTVAAPAGKWGPKSSRIFSGMLMLPVDSRSADEIDCFGLILIQV
jgi:hypothetical protein